MLFLSVLRITPSLQHSCHFRNTAWIIQLWGRAHVNRLRKECNLRAYAPIVWSRTQKSSFCSPVQQRALDVQNWIERVASWSTGCATAIPSCVLHGMGERVCQSGMSLLI
jgi:hypothetical protein